MTSLWRLRRFAGWALKAKLTHGSLAIVVADQEVLLTRARFWDRQEWTLPGGFMNLGETPAQTASRELKEETGLDVDHTAFVAVGEHKQQWAWHYDHVFAVEYSAPMPPSGARRSLEVVQLEWFPLDALPLLNRSSEMAMQTWSASPSGNGRATFEVRPPQSSRMYRLRHGYVRKAIVWKLRRFAGWMLKAKLTHGALTVLVASDHVLLSRSRLWDRQAWALPGGFLNSDELPSHAAVRKINSAIPALAIDPAALDKIENYRQPWAWHYEHLFGVERPNMVAVSDSNRALAVAEYRWFPLSSVPLLNRSSELGLRGWNLSPTGNWRATLTDEPAPSVEELTPFQARAKTTLQLLRSQWTTHARTASLLVALSALVLSGFIARDICFFDVPSAPTITGFVLLACTYVFIRLAFLGTSPRSVASALTEPNDEDQLVGQIAARASELLDQTPQRTIGLLVAMLRNPAFYRLRLEEHVELDARTTRKTVTLEVNASDAAGLRESDASSTRSENRDDRVLIPIMQPRKGHLFDRLVISDDSGETLTSLPYETSSALLVAAILDLYVGAYGLQDSWDDWNDDQRGRFLTIVALVIGSNVRMWKSAFSRTRYRPTHQDTVDLARADLERLLEVTPVNPDAHQKLAHVAGLCIANYVIMVDCKAGDQPRKIRYSYEIPTSQLLQDANPKEGSRLTRLVQRTLGIPGGFVEVKLDRAERALSYHLYVRVPAGSYIGPTLIHDAHQVAIGVNPYPEVTVGIPYLRPVSQYGTSAQVYARNLSGHLQHSLRLRLRVCENPWGTELLGWIAATSALVLAGILKSASFDGSETDVVVAFLALPAAVAGVGALFASATKRSMVVSTAGAGITAMATLATIAVVIVYASATPHARESSQMNTFWTWSITLLAPLVVTASSTLAIRIRRYVTSGRG